VSGLTPLGLAHGSGPDTTTSNSTTTGHGETSQFRSV